MDTINRVNHALKDTDDPETQARLLEELVKYAEFHFISEENVAAGMSSPELARHRERHQEILREIRLHVQQLLDGVYTSDEFVVFLLEWFAGHTIHEDRRLLGLDKPSI